MTLENLSRPMRASSTSQQTGEAEQKLLEFQRNVKDMSMSEIDGYKRSIKWLFREGYIRDMSLAKHLVSMNAIIDNEIDERNKKND